MRPGSRPVEEAPRLRPGSRPVYASFIQEELPTAATLRRVRACALQLHSLRSLQLQPPDSADKGCERGVSCGKAPPPCGGLYRARTWSHAIRRLDGQSAPSDQFLSSSRLVGTTLHQLLRAPLEVSGPVLLVRQIVLASEELECEATRPQLDDGALLLLRERTFCAHVLESPLASNTAHRPARRRRERS